MEDHKEINEQFLILKIIQAHVKKQKSTWLELSCFFCFVFFFAQHQTVIELELKGSLFSRASGHEKQTARQASAGHHTFHSVSHKSRTKALCVRSGGLFKRWPTFLPRCHANIPDWHSIREIWTKARWSFISTALFARLVSSNMRDGLSGTLQDDGFALW